MFNLFRMDTYRLLHSKVTWVILVFVVALAIFSVVMTNSDIELMKEEAAETGVSNSVGVTVQEEGEEARTFGIAIWPEDEWVSGDIEIGSLVSAETQSGLLLLLISIFTAIFVHAEQKNGYIKNIAGLFPKRGKIVLSKAITIAVYVLIMLALFMAVMVITGYVLWGDGFYMGSVPDFLKFFGTQYALHLGISMVIMLLCMLTRSSAFSMTAGILITAGLLAPVYSIVNKLVNDTHPGWEFDLNRYTLDGCISMTQAGADAETLLRAVIVGVAFIIASLLLSMVIMKKRDIR